MADVTVPESSNKIPPQPKSGHAKLCMSVGLFVLLAGLVQLTGILGLVRPVVGLILQHYAIVFGFVVFCGSFYLAARWSVLDHVVFVIFVTFMAAFWWYFPALILREDGTVISWAAVATTELGIAIVCVCQVLHGGNKEKRGVFYAVFTVLNILLMIVSMCWAAAVGCLIPQRNEAATKFIHQLTGEGYKIDDNAVGQTRVINSDGKEFECEIRFKPNRLDVPETHCVPKVSQ
jgi:hypothetical protein